MNAFKVEFDGYESGPFSYEKIEEMRIAGTLPSHARFRNAAMQEWGDYPALLSEANRLRAIEAAIEKHRVPCAGERFMKKHSWAFKDPKEYTPMEALGNELCNWAFRVIGIIALFFFFRWLYSFF